MTCAWPELLAILPGWMRKNVDQLNGEMLQEVRLRINAPPELVCQKQILWLSRSVTEDDLNFVVNTVTRYSPWAAATSSKGFLTGRGGHRIGLCGEVIVQNGGVSGISTLNSLCIRVARDVPDVASGVENVSGSILILGAPGWGKTTLLRDAIRRISQTETVCVVDERKEIFPKGFLWGKRMDVLSGCGKVEGMGMLLRTMSPDCIAVDEITDPEDCRALIQAANCGVRLLATAHASSLQDFRKRKVYQLLLENAVFDVCAVLNQHQEFTVERVR